MGPPADAAVRLAGSREDIDRWLAREASLHAPAAGGAPPAGPAPAVSPVLGGLLGLLARRWLGPADTAGGGEVAHLGVALVQASLSPLARRHPWALIGGAAAIGALLVGARRARRPGLWLAPVLTPLLTPMLAPLLTPLWSAVVSRWTPRDPAPAPSPASSPVSSPVAPPAPGAGPSHSH
jgi:hypothetical protein